MPTMQYLIKNQNQNKQTCLLTEVEICTVPYMLKVRRKLSFTCWIFFCSYFGIIKNTWAAYAKKKTWHRSPISGSILFGANIELDGLFSISVAFSWLTLSWTTQSGTYPLDSSSLSLNLGLPWCRWLRHRQVPWGFESEWSWRLPYAGSNSDVILSHTFHLLPLAPFPAERASFLPLALVLHCPPCCRPRMAWSLSQGSVPGSRSEIDTLGGQKSRLHNNVQRL